MIQEVPIFYATLNTVSQAPQSGVKRFRIKLDPKSGRQIQPLIFYMTRANADELANHFYEQGKADAIKETMANAKNINMDPRKSAEGYVDAGGVKVRAISGDNKSGLKLKLKNY